MSPKVSMALVASAASSWAPLLAMMRNADRSAAAMRSGPSVSSRLRRTGTTASAVQRCSARATRVLSGSKRRRTTSVEPMATARVDMPSPQAWKSGGATIVTSRPRKGIRDRIAAAGRERTGASRLAPFGVPVVPLVRMTTRPAPSDCRAGPGCPS